MKKPIGVTFEIGCREQDGKRKWYMDLSWLKLRKMRPSYKGQDARYGGLKLDLMLGSWRRPVPKLYSPGFYLRGSVPYETWEQTYNPWNSGNWWKIIPKWLVLPGFFFSLSYGAGKRQPGIYFGCKSYEVNRISQNLKQYMPNRDDIIYDKESWGSDEEKGNIYLAPSASLREDMVDG